MMLPPHSERGFTPPVEKKRFKEFRGDIDIFVPQNLEDAYLAAHGIDIRRLSNGAMIAGATRRVEDSALASVHIAFPSGAYLESKPGINHLLEHLVANKASRVADKSGGESNAFTSALNMTVQLGGRAHPDVREYGLWPIIPASLQSLVSPLDVSERELEAEKRIIIAEMKFHSAKPEEAIQERLAKILYDPSNPFNYNVIGTPESVRSVSVDEINQRHKKFFISNGLVAAVFAEGSPHITADILDQIQSTVERMPQIGIPERIDDALTEKLNPNFKPGKLFMEDTGIRNQMVRLGYAWIMPSIRYTAQEFALWNLLQVINKKAFQFFRDTGHTYAPNNMYTLVNQNQVLVGFTMDTESRKDIAAVADSLYPKFKEHVFEEFTYTDIEQISRNTHARTAATPIQVKNRFEEVLTGLNNYGRVIDSDKVVTLHQMATPEHFKDALDILRDIPPARIIIGDLN